MTDTEKIYWDNFYKSNPDIREPSDFAKYIHTKYIAQLNKSTVFLKIGDLGCGNCRDSLFFASLGNYVYAIDKSSIPYNTHTNLNLILDDVETSITNNKLETLLDLVYMRWFLHSVPYDKGAQIFTESIKNLKPNALLCIEVRSSNDTELIKNSTYNESDKSYSTTHKRWLYSIEMIKKLAEENNLDVIELVENYDFSKTNNNEAYVSNPLLIRFVARKKLIQHYEISKNFNIYKDILPEKKNRSLLSYKQIPIFNKILRVYNVKYIAIAGTILGLSRHGGIIPWDDDVDVGFIKSEWNKLSKLKTIFEKNGLKYTAIKSNAGKAGSTHCHFGTIDCFLLRDIPGEYYAGDAKTFCHKEEYKNCHKQIFGPGPVFINAPFCSKKSLSYRYGKTYFEEGDVNDNRHYKNNSIGRFELNHNDYSFQLFK